MWVMTIIENETTIILNKNDIFHSQLNSVNCRLSGLR